MSKLEELLKKHCPNGAEYKALSDLGSFYAGLNGKNKDDFKDGNAKYITYMNVFSNLSVNININDTVQIGKKEKQNIVKYGDVIFTGSSETIEECGMSSVVTNELNEKLYLNSFCFGFRFNEPEIMLPDFSKYLFRSTELRKKIIKTASGVTRFNVSKKKMEKILIPLPPIEVQKEIVRILDTFTKYQDLLNRELELRKKQYEYYRDKLLTFDNNIEFKSLSECILNTNNIKWNINQDKKFKYIDLSSVSRENNQVLECQVIDYETAPSRAQQIVIKDDVIFGTTRPMLKRMCIIPKTYDNQICSTGFCVLRANKQIVLPKWILYCISTKDFFIYVDKNQKGASYPAILDKEVKKYKIPVPPLEEQKRIVNILDKFDALCNDITKGLPAEIELRKKQYEYYRDKLLTFKEKKK